MTETNHAPIGEDALREALWICVEHNALHFGETHNTVVQGRAALASAAQPPAPTYDPCGGCGKDGAAGKQVLGSKNCMQLCVSYMLGLSLLSVPDFEADGGWYQFVEFAASQGYAAVMLSGNHEFEADYLASGTTKRGTSHMVVMNDGKLVYDPHPSNAGLDDVQCVWLLAKRAHSSLVHLDEHAAFEARAQAYTSNVSFERDASDYVDMTATLLWHGWKLCASRGQVPAPAAVVGRGDSHHVVVPRGLIGAACSAIDRHGEAPKLLHELRRYTVGDLSKAAPVEQGDAERYRMVRRGQRWSVIDGAGDTLRAEALDAAIDAADWTLHSAIDYWQSRALEAERLLRVPKQLPYCWIVPPSSKPFFGEFAELDAKAEAQHCGGTAVAIPLYATPQPVARELPTDDQKQNLNPYKHSRSAASIWLAGFEAAERHYGIGEKP